MVARVDWAETIDEGMLGWLTRHADARPASADHHVGRGVLVLSDRVVGDVEAACARWGLASRRRDAQPGWTVLLVSGRSLPVVALCDVIQHLRLLGARA